MKLMEGQIPDKLYFRIGEVSDIVGVKPYVLRYWESEFSDIHPTKSKSGQRLYKRKDVEMLMAIKKLLYEERFTINGARKRLKELSRGETLVETVSRDEPEAAIHTTNIPRQLEVFPQSSGDDIPVRGGRAAAPDNRKVLLKLKKDLTSLLEELAE